MVATTTASWRTASFEELVRTADGSRASAADAPRFERNPVAVNRPTQAAEVVADRRDPDSIPGYF